MLRNACSFRKSSGVFGNAHTPMNCKLFAAASALGIFTVSAPAAFHVIQIEQVIGSVGGNPLAQAVTLRFRGGGQIFLGPTRIVSFDANGLNPLVLFDFTDDFGGNAEYADRILLTTPAFDAGMLAYQPTF